MILSFQLRPARTVGSRGAVKKLFKKKKKKKKLSPQGRMRVMTTARLLRARVEGSGWAREPGRSTEGPCLEFL